MSPGFNFGGSKSLNKFNADIRLREVRKIVAYWQRQLRLEDWRVSVEILPARTLERNSAKVDYEPHCRTAVISIADDWENAFELHDCIVHELLHLFFSWLPQESQTLVLEEQAIHSIAPVMARLYLVASTFTGGKGRRGRVRG